MSALPTFARTIFGIAEFSFPAILLPMNFQKSLSGYTANQIIAAFGCPRGTAYDWLDGRRAPPEWQQRHWLAILRKAGEQGAAAKRRGGKISH